MCALTQAVKDLEARQAEVESRAPIMNMRVEEFREHLHNLNISDARYAELKAMPNDSLHMLDLVKVREGCGEGSALHMRSRLRDQRSVCVCVCVCTQHSVHPVVCCCSKANHYTSALFLCNTNTLTHTQIAVHDATSKLAADNEHLRMAANGAKDTSGRTAEEAARLRCV